MRRLALGAALAGALAVILAGGCRQRRGTRVEPATAPPIPDSVFIAVVNDNYYDARVHLVYDGAGRHSLGTIAGNRRQAAQALPWYPRPMWVEVALIVGGGVYRSDRIDVGPGELVEVRIPPDLNMSGFFRRVSGGP